MKHVAAALLVALVSTAWATCAAAAPGETMACCVKVQHDCPQMQQVKMCCPEGQPAKPDTTATAAVPLTSVHVQSHALFLSRAAVSAVLEVTLLPLQAVPHITPPSHHSIDCILLI